MRYNEVIINLKGDDNIKSMTKIIENVNNEYYEVTTKYNNGLEDIYILKLIIILMIVILILL